MKKIEKTRHSLAHILAYAVQEIYPQVKFGMGPAIEDGFYYDFEFPENISKNDLQKIEAKMKEIIKKGIEFKQERVSRKKTQEIFQDQPYKLEIIEDIPDDKISLYRSGDFVDVCKGPHLKSSQEINPDAFQLDRLAGAYWKGNEENEMLQRIYGLAFKTEEKLQQYLQAREKAKQRDHRKLGKQLDLFDINPQVGPGLVLWHPKGALILREIKNYVLDQYIKHGYKPVITPHIAKSQLWDTSGHTDFYKESMFPPMHLKEIDPQENEDYQLKPMNCPFHVLLYKRKTRSYRDLPLRYTELGTVYRYEKSGTLHGLTRVRGFTQDDAHIWCTPDQLESELKRIMKFAFKLLNDFGFEDYKVYLATQPDDYIGKEEVWKKSIKALKKAAEKAEVDYHIEEGEGAFYGPKIDIYIEDSLGREWQCTTIQLDFNMPERFDMTYVNEEGEKKTPIMIHRALLGSLERFVGILLEYYGGDLPLWIAPVQVGIIPIGESHREYAQQVSQDLQKIGVRTVIADGDKTVGKKIFNLEKQKLPYILVVGDKEQQSEAVNVRKDGEEQLMKKDEFIQQIQQEIEQK